MVFGPLVLFEQYLDARILLLFKILKMIIYFLFLGEILFIRFSFGGDSLVLFPSSYIWPTLCIATEEDKIFYM